MKNNGGQEYKIIEIAKRSIIEDCTEELFGELDITSDDICICIQIFLEKLNRRTNKIYTTNSLGKREDENDLGYDDVVNEENMAVCLHKSAIFEIKTKKHRNKTKRR